ncbi:MAG: choice-of-anchor B family protein [Bacteroidota bacterium]
MKKATLFLAFLLTAIAPAWGQFDSLNVTRVGSLSYPTGLNDVWGYVDSTGTEWGLVGSIAGVSIVNLANPANPVEAFFLPGDTILWRDIKTWGNYAYVSNECCFGLRIIDLSDLPNNVTYKDTVIDGVTTIHNLWIDEFGYLYSTGDNVNQGMTIFDLNQDPWNPNVIGIYPNTYCHDVYVRDNLAYTAEMNAGQLGVVDVTDKANLQVLGVKPYQGAFTHNTWLDSSGTVCFSTDELPEAYVISWDVSDPNNIEELDRIRSSQSPNSTPHNAHYHNGFLFTSFYQDGLMVIDAHRPQNMVEVGYYDTHLGNNSPFEGMWGAYPFLPSGLILTTDMEGDFNVLQFNGQRASYIEGTATNTNTQAPVTNVNVEILGTSSSDLSRNSGDYDIGLLSSATVTVRASKFGYVTVDTVVTLVPGGVIPWDPQMVPLTPIGMNLEVRDAVTGAPLPNTGIQAVVSAATFNYTTNSSGQVSDPGFIQETYRFLAYRWGHVFLDTTILVTVLTNNIVLEMEPGYYDNFAFDLGWTPSNGTGTAGYWERADPIGSQISFPTFLGVNPEDDAAGDYGDQCFVTGNNETLINNDDVDGGGVVLASPMMDLSGYNNPMIVFDWWMVGTTFTGGNSFRDSLVVEIDNGNVRQRVWAVRDRKNDFWTTDTIFMTNYLWHTSTTQVFFIASDNMFDNLVEAGIDVFRVVDQSTVAAERPRNLQLSAAPNPSSGDWTLEYALGATPDGTLSLIDIQGKVRQTISLTESEGKIRLAGQGLAPGIYLGVLESPGQGRQVVKLIRY